VGAVNLGILPDLRYSPTIQTPDAWKAVVLGGAMEESGMVSFAPVLDEKAAEAIRAFVIAQAHAATK
jgi:hypothetical protein